ncbi:MAG: hypothetical protein Q4D62_01770 [Planctomycetia bacterium]|nr:hypothetical protein [Planctomycetia bacterium]
MFFRLSVFVSFFLLFATLHAARISFEEGVMNTERVEVGDCPALPSGKGVRLQAGLKATPPTEQPDLVLHVNIPEAGVYRFWSRAGATEEVQSRLRLSRSKKDSIPIFMAINDGLASLRYVIEPWRNLDACQCRLGLFELPEGPSTIRIWLPEGVWFACLEYARYIPPQIPEAARDYQPRITPPPTHPRILVTPEWLPQIRERLTQGENRAVWESVLRNARKPFSLEFPDNQTVGHHAHLLRVIQAKAFVYLMTGEEACGREAIVLATRYLERVEYGNMLDITREIGQTIVTGSWVYDWCFPLLSEEERGLLERHLLRLANQMECGWPPFGQSIVNGHGAEAQIMRDLLTMSLAIYDTHPEAYRFCSWQILEELVPMRRWEYQSPRHNQGINYGNYRIQFEYICDLLFERFCGERVFHPNLASMPLYFLSMRLPNGEAFADGDCYNRGILNYAPAALVMAAHCAGSPEAESVPALDSDYVDSSHGPTRVAPSQLARLVKAQYFRERGGRLGSDDAVFFLLVNDPAVKPDFSFDTLPLAFDSGSRLGSQILRTGWMKETWLQDGKTAEPDSDDVVIELKGAGYHSANHQHFDAGAFQIYYRGWLSRDLGIYHFYGLPYDRNFNKGSSSHNVCLILNPDGKIPNGMTVHDGGQNVVLRSPRSPKEVLENPSFQTGRVLESVVEPSAKNPKRSSYRVDLTPAYADRAESYIRSFAWVRTDRRDVPVLLAVLDRMTVKDSGFRRFWQMNTLNKPNFCSESWHVESLLPTGATISPGRLVLTPLLPRSEERSVELIGDEKANSIFGVPFIVPIDIPEANGWRLLLEDKNSDASRTTVFLNVFQVLGEKGDGTPAEPLPIQWEEKNGRFFITVGDQTLTME